MSASPGPNPQGSRSGPRLPTGELHRRRGDVSSPARAVQEDRAVDVDYPYDDPDGDLAITVTDGYAVEYLP